MAFRPQPFGRYELLDRISAGGMAEVFRARDPKRDLIVALKRILPEVAEDEEFIAMFEDEARIVSTLEHPHIARALDFGQAENEWFISFEYVEGRDLRKLWNRCVERDEHPPVAVLLYIFTRIGEGLAYAHARKDNQGRPTSLVHRDVSPQNIVVSFDGDVKLIDFGIAKAQGKLTRTQAGTIKGKFGYMAPEQVRGQEVDSRADVFALGVCLWEMLTLKRLFVAENELRILEKIRTMVVPPPSSINKDLPPQLDEIVLKALAKNVDERYRAAKDLYRELNIFSHDFGEVATRDEVAQYMRHAFPEAGKPLDDSRANMALSKGGRRSSTEVPAAEDPYRLADLSEIADEDFAQTGVMTPMHVAAAEKAHASERGPKSESDVEVFEGMGRTGVIAAVNTKDAPPPSASTAFTAPVIRPSIDPSEVMQTLMGVGAVTANIDPDGPPPTSRRTPPPPPGRGSLPSVSSMMTAPRLVPPPAPMAHPPSTRSPAISMVDAPPDWDDEDVATNIVDRPSELQRAAKPTFSKPNSTLMGIGNAIMGNASLGNASPSNAPLPPPVHPPPASVRPIRGSNSRFPGSGSLPAPSAPPPPQPQRPPTGSFMPTPMPPPQQSLLSRNSPASSRMTSSVPPPPSADNPFLSEPPPRMPEELPTGPLPIVDVPDNYTAPTLGILSLGRGGSGASSAMPIATPSAQSRMEATQMVNRSSGTKTGLWFLGTLGTVLLVVVAVVYLSLPKTGRLVVNVTDARGGPIDHLEVFLDGKKSCDTAPCYVDPLPIGVHEVKVLAEGYEAPGPRGTTIEARKDATVSFTLIGAPPHGGTGVKIAGSQPGVKLYIDGQEIGPLPQEIRTLTPGDHKIHLAGSDRYAPIDLPFTATKDQVQDLGMQTLKVVRGKATIISATPGSKLYIVSGSDRRELPAWPISVDIDTSKQWWLEAIKPGFDDYHQAISFDDGQAEKTFSIDLAAKGTTPTQSAQTTTSSTPSNAVVATNTQAAQVTAPVHTSRPAPTPAPAAGDDDDTSSNVASGEGFLNINSVPASSVVLDGKPIGQTPQLHVSVSPGTHQVVFINADQALKKQLMVTVKSGETKVAATKLRD